MDCFKEGPNFLVIDPSTCIDCSICVPECPVGAIVDASAANEAQKPYIELNARLANDPRWTTIRRSKAPPADHADWRGIEPKRHLLEGVQ